MSQATAPPTASRAATPSTTASPRDLFHVLKTPPARKPANANSSSATTSRDTYSTPFVDGMPPALGSDSVASRNARATALYWASAMWCGSRP